MSQIHDCTACDSRGRTLVREHDEFGETVTVVPCEDCDSCGYIGSCRRCGEAAPLTVLEDRSGLCFACAAEMEIGDAAEEMIRLSKRSA